MIELKKFIKSFGYAGKGIVRTLINERNMRVHFVCMIYMYSFLALTDWFKLSKEGWALIFVSNALVVAAELINTAIEKTVDLVTKEKNELAGFAKDAAAGAVLISAIFAVLTGLSLLLQKEAFISLFGYFSTHPVSLTVFILSLAVAVLFIFKGIPQKN